MNLHGLTSEEVSALRAEGKTNALPPDSNGSVKAILFRNVFTFFNLLNVILAVLLIIVGSYRNILFMGVVISNTVIGVIQEIRAKQVHDRLKLLVESKVSVLRDDLWQDISPSELVLGDLVKLGRGDQVPADGIVEDGQAQSDESLLTGESEPQNKQNGSPLYSGSFLVSGSVIARLTAVGSESYAGKLQLSAKKVKRARSELMTDLQKLIRLISMILLPVGLILFFRQYSVLHLSIESSVTKTVASVLGMIPEGLILLTSVSLMAGVIQLGQKNVLVNELYGIETLARVDVLCTDKTGTLTSGEMVLDHIEGSSPEFEKALARLLSTFEDDTPTNRALKSRCEPDCLSKPVHVIPFSSALKWSAAGWNDIGTVFLGAPEKLTSGDTLAHAQTLAATGLRVLALTVVPDSSAKEPDCNASCALICLRDSLREGVQDTVRYFTEEGVTLKVLSGDSAATVAAVAEAAGIPNAKDAVDMSRITEKNYDDLAAHFTVFGRVSPEDKCGLVRSLQKQGHHTAMIGDGVNDIPALKAADCSIAIAGGSDAATRVSNITLMHGDFNSIPAVLLEGRRVVNNIARAASMFLVKNHFSLILSLVMMLLPFTYPFAPIQLTMISSLTIGMPGFILALQPNKERVQGNFLKNVITRSLSGGICAALAVLAVLFFGSRSGWDNFSISSLCTLAATISCIISLLLTSLPLNRLRAAMMAAVVILFILALKLIPGVFYLVMPIGNQWLLLAGIALLSPAVQLIIARLTGITRKS